MTFEELAKWADSAIFTTKANVKGFFLLGVIDKKFAFYSNGSVFVDDSIVFVNRTIEQMKQIIIMGGLKKET